MRFQLLLLAVIFLPLSWPGSGSAEIKCPRGYAVEIVALQGKLYYKPEQGDSNQWLEAHLNDNLCKGSRIKTGDASRATIKHPNDIFIKLDQNTIVLLKELENNQPSWLTLFKGFLHTISRTPKRLTIETPIANAGPEGTEFAMSVDEANASLWVYEGGVRFYNAKGSIKLKPGQSGQAKLGQAPQAKIDIKPQDAVNWALYYPPVLPEADKSKPIDADFQQVINDYRQGRIDVALNRLDSLPQGKQTPYFHKLRGALRLIVGLEQLALQDIQSVLANNPNDAEALALQSVRALSQNRKDEALSLAKQATSANPQSAAAYSALSYAEQGRFDLDKALIAAKQATKLAPQDAIVWARKAELELSLSKADDSEHSAQQASKLDPDLERTQTILGFSHLNKMNANKAQGNFEKALQLDSTSPLARLGLGLAKIRNGDLEEGREDLEIAATLDPNNAIVRSYLGKAYYEERRPKMADEQFKLAKERDPKDPTPYFYDAINKQTTNRPVEALHDMQKAIELNDNRGVYRSKLLLDKDIAARGATLGRIYNEIGFSQRGLVEGWRGIANDPTDYTSHRLLSDNYSALPRHDLARSSELLQSQLLQPINITPVQPRLAESQLFLLGGLGPSALSLNEFNPLFERNRFSLLASGLIGSNNTYSDEVVHSGLWDNFSYSLGQFHYQTDGFRKNNDIDTNIYNVFAQARLTPDLSLQTEYRHRGVDIGQLASYFEPTKSQQNSINNDRRQTETDTYRLGVHYSPTNHSDLLGSFIYIGQSATNYSANGQYDPTDNRHAVIGETQHIRSFDILKTVLGGGYFHQDISKSIVQNYNGYIYTQIRYPSTVDWTFGLSFNLLDDTKIQKELRSVNPKFGLMWNITPNTLFRAAAFRSVNTSRITYQTLEPVQVAGFNQFFDDVYRTEVSRFGIGIDQKFSSTLSGGIEVSRRYLDPHNLIGNGKENETRWREANYRGYLFWAPYPRWAGSIEFYRENFDNFSTVGARDTQTQVIPVGLSYFDPTGFFAKFKSSFYHQTVNLKDKGDKSDNVIFLDLSLGYRFPKRHGIFEIQFQNLLDQNYRYQGLQARQPDSTGVPQFLPFPPEFTVLARLTLAL